MDKKKAAARKAAQRAAASGILAKPQYEDGRGDQGPLSAEENIRASFWPLLGTAVEQQWKGMAKGSSAAGVAFGGGRPTLRANFSGIALSTRDNWLHKKHNFWSCCLVVLPKARASSNLSSNSKVIVRSVWYIVCKKSALETFLVSIVG